MGGCGATAGPCNHSGGRPLVRGKEEIGFIRADWSQAVVDHLGLIDGLTNADIDFYADEVAARRKGLMAVQIEGHTIGSLIWSIYTEPQGEVFVVEEMGAHSKGGVDLITATVRMAEVMCQRHDLKRMRFLTRREAFLRIMKDSFEVSYILERTL